MEGPDAVSLALVEDHQALREGLDCYWPARAARSSGSLAIPARRYELIERGRPDVALDRHPAARRERHLADAPPAARRPDLGVVLYTGHSDVDLFYEGLDSGARGYALKDGPPEELLEAIRSVAAGGTYVDPRLRPALLSRGAPSAVPHLSPREREVLDLLAAGPDRRADRRAARSSRPRPCAPTCATRWRSSRPTPACTRSRSRCARARSRCPTESRPVVSRRASRWRDLAHALRTPIAVIQGFADLLKRDDGRLTEEQRSDYADRIIGGAAEMREILDAATSLTDGAVAGTGEPVDAA